MQETAPRLRRDGMAIPFWRAATRPLVEIRQRAIALGVGEPQATAAMPGAGSAPGVTIPSFGVAVPGDHLAALRGADPPIVARLVEHRTICDLRTVEPEHDRHLAAALAAVIT
jgi:L-seryl-tRNA(Ser) seleniumtransferase